MAATWEGFPQVCGVFLRNTPVLTNKKKRKFSVSLAKGGKGYYCGICTELSPQHKVSSQGKIKPFSNHGKCIPALQHSLAFLPHYRGGGVAGVGKEKGGRRGKVHEWGEKLVKVTAQRHRSHKMLRFNHKIINHTPLPQFTFSSTGLQYKRWRTVWPVSEEEYLEKPKVKRDRKQEQWANLQPMDGNYSYSKYKESQTWSQINIKPHSKSQFNSFPMTWYISSFQPKIKKHCKM